tara:strand:+ start:164 stop:292 length:129 start_codon:yes stop_codon:yes gene_type:complete
MKKTRRRPSASIKYVENKEEEEEEEEEERVVPSLFLFGMSSV